MDLGLNIERKFLFSLIILFLPGLLFAQVGKIAGKVVDRETKEPLIGVNVIIEGTTLGASTDLNGNYVILNVPPGVYTMRAIYVGYQTITVKNVRVAADLATEVNFELSSYSQANIQIKLLPNKMSIVEKALWGEKGFFRITGIAPLTPEARERELKFRRTMLSMHQLGGFATLGLMALSGYYGKKVYDGKYEFVNRHRTLVRVTIASYTLTALLAITSPPPLIRRERGEGSLAIHKALAWIHSTGMIATAILGRNVRLSTNLEDYNRLKKIHMGVAIATFTSLASAMITIMLR